MLFDNPAADVGPGVVALQDMRITDVARQRLYDELAAVVADVDPDGMRARYGFCPLPRYSYHVTVCDGPNEHDLVVRDTASCAAAAAVVDALPGSADRVPAVFPWLCRARVLEAIAANPITLSATGVFIRGHVLAAGLEPPDPIAGAAFTQVARARRELSEDLRRELGLRVQPWRPHVSLGYFANRDAAAAARTTLTRWIEPFASRPRPTITFTTAAVYAFVDMVSFYRLGGSP